MLPYSIELVPDDPLPADVSQLLFDVLYRDYGIDELSEWFHPAAGGTLALARAADGELQGVARLLGQPGDCRRQLRQVAVAPSCRGRGIGRAVVRALHERAAREGAQETWLNARESAFDFYQRLGYVLEGEMFVSEMTRIAHRRMRHVVPRGLLARHASLG